MNCLILYLIMWLVRCLLETAIFEVGALAIESYVRYVHDKKEKIQPSGFTLQTCAKT